MLNNAHDIISFTIIKVQKQYERMLQTTTIQNRNDTYSHFGGTYKLDTTISNV